MKKKSAFKKLQEGTDYFIDSLWKANSMKGIITFTLIEIFNICAILTQNFITNSNDSFKILTISFLFILVVINLIKSMYLSGDIIADFNTIFLFISLGGLLIQNYNLMLFGEWIAGILIAPSFVLKILFSLINKKDGNKKI